MIYFDNITTTKPDKIAIETLANITEEFYGSTLSLHKIGRKAKIILEESREIIAGFFNADNTEIIFTSSGTEANNTVISSCVNNLNIKNIIYSDNEILSIKNTAKHFQNLDKINTFQVKHTDDGKIDLNDLENIISKNTNSLVAFSHADNQTGNLLRINKISNLCKKYGALFLLDTSLTFGLYNVDLKVLSVDFMTVSPHKFHSPKGVGILYVNDKIRINPLLHGENQEYYRRAGTENLPGIVATAKVFNILKNEIKKNRNYISDLKNYFIEKIKQNFPQIKFYKNSNVRGLVGFVNILLPKAEKTEMIVEKFDMKNIAVSYGNFSDNTFISVRFSFGKYNTFDEIHNCILAMKDINIC